MKKPVIRPPAQPADFDACFELFQILAPDINKKEYDENIRRAITLNDKIFLLELGGKVIGVTTFSEQADPTMGPYILLSHTITHPDYRDQSYGRQLLDFVEDYARQHKYPVVRVITRGFRVDAHAFYKKHGYEQTRLIFEKGVSA